MTMVMQLCPPFWNRYICICVCIPILIDYLSSRTMRVICLHGKELDFGFLGLVLSRKVPCGNRVLRFLVHWVKFEMGALFYVLI